MTDLTRHLPQCEVTRTARGDLFIQWIRKSGLARLSMGVWGSSCVTAARLVTVNETRSATLSNASAACLPRTCASCRAYTPRSHDDPDDWWLSSRYGWIEKKEVHGVDGGDKQGRERQGRGGRQSRKVTMMSSLLFSSCEISAAVQLPVNKQGSRWLGRNLCYYTTCSWLVAKACKVKGLTSRLVKKKKKKNRRAP